LGALGPRRLAGCGGAGITRSLATVFSEIGEQRVHGLEARGIDHRAAVAANRDQSSPAQTVEMEGERVRREFESVGHLACRHSLRPGLHKQPKHLEAIVLGERGERSDNICFFHISTNIEKSAECQALFRWALK